MAGDELNLDDVLAADLAEAEGGPSASVMDSMLEAVVRDTVGRNPSIRDRLRELTTPVRLGLIAASMLLVGAGTTYVQGGARDDLSGGSLLRFAVTMLALLGLWALATATALRGRWKGPLGWLGWGIAVATLALPLGLALVPGLWEGVELPPDIAMVVHRRCALFAALTTAVMAGIVALFERSDRPAPLRMLALGGGSGIVGFVFQGVHCPAMDPVHLLVAHGLAGAGIGALLLVIAWIRQR